MRTLTLDEKITLKERLARQGVLPSILVRLDMRELCFLWPRCFAAPIKDYAKL